MAHGVTYTHSMFLSLFCGLVLTLYGVYSHGQRDVLSLCASRWNSMSSTKSVRGFPGPRWHWQGSWRTSGTRGKTSKTTCLVNRSAAGGGSLFLMAVRGTVRHVTRYRETTHECRCIAERVCADVTGSGYLVSVGLRARQTPRKAAVSAHAAGSDCPEGR